MAPQFMDSLQIPGDADQIPFPVNRFDPSERKLSKSKHRFDDPKNDQERNEKKGPTEDGLTMHSDQSSCLQSLT
jgi:hypothetical protein